MIRVGVAGWSYPDWEGVVYPRPKPRGFHPLSFLARFFDCIEINGSFYAAPQARNAARWVELVADRPAFRFSAKLERIFTHEALPRADGELHRRSEAFLEGIEPLRAAGRLWALLLQFPLSFRFGPAALERLRRLEACFGHLPCVLEVRHRSWFEAVALAEIGALGLSLAAIDLPAAPEHPPLDPPNVGPLGYLRLHGRNATTWFDPRAGRDQRYDYLYAADELAQLVKTTRRLATGRDETFVITNNHFSGKAVANALELLAALGHRPPPAPGDLVQAFPHLCGITRAQGQRGLF